jgi:hypothetical protein
VGAADKAQQAAQAVRVVVAQVLAVEAQQQQAQQIVAAVAALATQPKRAVAELFMSGLRFSYGTFCENTKQHSTTSYCCIK